MLLHELGHIAHQDPVLVTASAKAEEHEADRFATSHVLDGVSDAAILLKRSIGIAVANVVLILIDFIASSAVDSHPDPEERLSRNLRENQLANSNPVHAFATAMMQVHLQRFGVPLVLEENENFASFVDDFCLALKDIGSVNVSGYRCLLFAYPGGSFFFIAPPMCCLDIIWVIVSPRPSHSFGILMVGDDVAIVGKLFVADGAYPALFDNFAVHQLSHLGW